MRQTSMLTNPKIQEFLTLLQDPEVYGVFKGLVMQVLVDPDCFLLKRVSNIENHLGADEFYCIGEDSQNEDKEVIMTIQEQLALISERINDASTPYYKETIFSGNETEIRARFLKEKIQDTDYRNGTRFMDSKEVRAFLLHEVPEGNRTTEKAARKVASDVMKKAVDLYPEELSLTKNKKGLNIIVCLGKR